MKALSYVAIGALFALGLVLAGMTDPHHIVGFLDFSGDFDPTLLLVMAGAVLVHAAFYRLIRRRSSPLWASGFSVPAPASVDKRLVVGSALFGVGWGLGGYCPGPALVSVPTLHVETLTFVGAMLLGMLVFAVIPLDRS